LGRAEVLISTFIAKIDNLLISLDPRWRGLGVGAGAKPPEADDRL